MLTPTHQSYPRGTTHSTVLPTRFVILLSMLGTLFAVLIIFTIYVRYNGCLYRALARHLATKDHELETRALPPRINKRNARFFSPGLRHDRNSYRDDLERGMQEGQSLEMKVLVVETHKFRGIERPGKAYGGWRDAGRG